MNGIQFGKLATNLWKIYVYNVVFSLKPHCECFFAPSYDHIVPNSSLFNKCNDFSFAS